MSSIEKRQRARRTTWRAHYRTPDGKQRNKTFSRKVDAEQFLVTTEAAKLSGSYVDQRLSRVRLGDWSQQWLASQGQLKPATHERYAGILRRHVVPRWGNSRLTDVSHAAIQTLGHRGRREVAIDGEEGAPGVVARAGACRS